MILGVLAEKKVARLRAPGWHRATQGQIRNDIVDLDMDLVGMQVAPEWGLTYEGSIKLYPDNSFAENVAAGADDNAIFKLGTWKLMNNNSSIIFYSVINDLGTIYRDTTEFHISIDSMGNLILKNDQNFIRHIKTE